MSSEAVWTGLNSQCFQHKVAAVPWQQLPRKLWQISAPAPVGKAVGLPGENRSYAAVKKSWTGVPALAHTGRRTSHNIHFPRTLQWGVVQQGLYELYNLWLMSRYSINGSYNDFFTDITDLSLLVNLKLAGGLNNAFYAEPAIGLSVQWTLSKCQLNICMILCPEGQHLKVGLNLQWLIKFSDYGCGVCTDFIWGLC